MLSDSPNSSMHFGPMVLPRAWLFVHFHHLQLPFNHPHSMQIRDSQRLITHKLPPITQDFTLHNIQHPPKSRPRRWSQLLIILLTENREQRISILLQLVTIQLLRHECRTDPEHAVSTHLPRALIPPSTLLQLLAHFRESFKTASINAIATEDVFADTAYWTPAVCDAESMQVFFWDENRLCDKCIWEI